MLPLLTRPWLVSPPVDSCIMSSLLLIPSDTATHNSASLWWYQRKHPSGVGGLCFMVWRWFVGGVNMDCKATAEAWGFATDKLLYGDNLGVSLFLNLNSIPISEKNVPQANHFNRYFPYNSFSNWLKNLGWDSLNLDVHIPREKTLQVCQTARPDITLRIPG